MKPLEIDKTLREDIMTRRNLSITIAIGFIALFGIIAVQLHWIRSAYVQNKISFEQNLNKALNQIVHDLSRQENIFFDENIHKNIRFIDGTVTLSHLNNAKNVQLKWQRKAEKDKLPMFKASQKKKNEAFKRIISKNQSDRKIVIRSIDDNIEIIQEFHLDSLAEQIESQLELKATAITLLTKDSLLRKYESRIDSVREMLDYRVFTIASEKEDLNKTMVELFMNIRSVTRPFAERIPIDKLQSSIEDAIEQYDLPKLYAFAISTPSADSILFKTDNFNTEEINQAHCFNFYFHLIIVG